MCIYICFFISLLSLISSFIPATISWQAEENHFGLCSKTNLERRCRKPGILPDPLQAKKTGEETEKEKGGETGESVWRVTWISSIQKSKLTSGSCPQLASTSRDPLLPPKLRQDRCLPELWHLEMAKGDLSRVRDSVLSGVAPAVLLPLCLCLGVPLRLPSTSRDVGGKFKPSKTLGRTQAAGGDGNGERDGDTGWKSLLAGERENISICWGAFGEKYGYVLVYPSFGRQQPWTNLNAGIYMLHGDWWECCTLVMQIGEHGQPERLYPKGVEPSAKWQGGGKATASGAANLSRQFGRGCSAVVTWWCSIQANAGLSQPVTQCRVRYCYYRGLISQRWRKLWVKTDSKRFHSGRHKLTWMSL